MSVLSNEREVLSLLSLSPCQGPPGIPGASGPPGERGHKV